MKKPESNINKCIKSLLGSTWLNPWRKASKLMTTGAALLVVSLLVPLAQAQTNMTIKPFQVRVEVPAGFNGAYYLTNCNLRIPTNGATGTDITGTNWVIANVNVSISGAPAGCTASLVNNDLVTPVGTIPVNMNTGNTAQNTNLVVSLVFNGTQSSGVSTLIITATGGGLPDDSFLLPLEVAKIWNGETNAVVNGAGNWSDSSQWLNGVPGPSDNVVFTDVGAQTNLFVSGTNQLTNSIVDVSTTISSLRFSQTNSTHYQNLAINPGVTLAIGGNDGFSMLRDYTYWTLGLMRVSIYGSGGTLMQTNENASFSILSDAQQQSVLDMSQLGNLYLDVNRLYLSDYQGYPNYANLVYTNGYTSTTAGAGKPQRFYQTWNMAGTNYIKATYVDPYNYTNALSRSYALSLGRNESSGGGSGPKVEMLLGYSNVFNLDSICVAGPSSLGSDFRFLNPNSYAIFRNADGVSRMSMFATADDGGQVAGDKSKCGGNGPGVDFNGGTVDMLVDRLYLSLDATNNATGNGYSQTSGFEFSAGIIDANTAILGYQSQGNAATLLTCFANMTVSNTAVFRVNNNLVLGYTTGNVGNSAQYANASYGKLNIGPGGTVMANNISVGGVTKASTGNNIALTGGASLIVSNGIADASDYGALGLLSFGGNSSLTLFVNTTSTVPLVYVTNLTASSTGNKLIIGGIVTNASDHYPVTVPLIFGANASIPVLTSVFDAGVTMPPGYHGVLLANPSANEIDLQIYNRQPNYLVWRGPAGVTGTADWDYSSLNWQDQVTGLMTNYNNPDFVSFDDTPGYATNINIAGGTTALSPAGMAITNSTLYYTFLDGGNQILGGPTLNKYGTGTVEVDGNTTASVSVNQGVLTGSSPGAVGGVSIAAGAVMNYGGSIGGSVTCYGTGTSSGSISGSLTVQTGGVFTNSGTLANPFLVKTGGLFYNAASGALKNVGVGSSGSPQVASGGIFINNGAVGLLSGANILYVDGTFEDLGGGSDNITLQSVTIGAGGTFIPGGNGTGTTTINSDGTGTFPGAALLVQGATNIFYVNPGGSPLNTVLTSDYLSFGGSASVRSQNGCTLVINNIGTPFSAGQTFQLFNNVFVNGKPPFNTGTSTNTYPVINPATPGAGLAWDLSQLWVSGSIGVVSANSGPALVNSFINNGTNIVAQFSWDSAYQGYRLQTEVEPNTVGLSLNPTNWTGVNGSWTNTSVTLTNAPGTNSVFYRLVFP